MGTKPANIKSVSVDDHCGLVAGRGRPLSIRLIETGRSDALTRRRTQEVGAEERTDSRPLDPGSVKTLRKAVGCFRSSEGFSQAPSLAGFPPPNSAPIRRHP